MELDVLQSCHWQAVHETGQCLQQTIRRTQVQTASCRYAYFSTRLEQQEIGRQPKFLFRPLRPLQCAFRPRKFQQLVLAYECSRD